MKTKRANTSYDIDEWDPNTLFLYSLDRRNFENDLNGGFLAWFIAQLQVWDERLFEFFFDNRGAIPHIFKGKRIFFRRSASKLLLDSLQWMFLDSNDFLEYGSCDIFNNVVGMEHDFLALYNSHLKLYR